MKALTKVSNTIAVWRIAIPVKNLILFQRHSFSCNKGSALIETIPWSIAQRPAAVLKTDVNC